MSRRVEVSFQIDEEVLGTAIVEIHQAFSQFDSSTNSFEEVNALLNKLSNRQNRFPVEPGDEDDDE